MHHLEPWHPI